MISPMILRLTPSPQTCQRVLISVLSSTLALGPVATLAAPKASSASTPSREPVTLNFVNAEIDAVSRAMATILGRPIVVDPRIKGTITLYSEQPLTPREAFLNYMAALRGLGHTVIDVAGLLKVVPEADAKVQTGTVSVGAVTRAGDQILTQIFRLQHENANNLVAVLRPLISPNNTINANPGNNSLVITDYADNLKRIATIIAATDVPSGTEVEVISLKHAVAADLAPVVQRFADAGAATAVAGQPGGSSGSGVTISADSRTNTLLVRAPNPTRMAMMRSTIERLDRPAAGSGIGGNIYVVHLKNADATKLATVLRAAYGAGGSSGASSGTGINLPTPNAPSGASPQATSPVSASAGPSTGGFIQADPATNALIITAPEPVYRQLRAVIEQLDARRAQVYVESMIVKMDAQQAAEFGFQWQNLIGSNGDKTGAYMGTNFNNGSSPNIVNLSAAAATGSANVTLGTGFNVGLLRNINGIYTLGGLARFLQNNTDSNILSTPNLVTLDNEEAKIVIGQNVPFVTGNFTNTGTSNGSANPFQTIERKDVGLTLRVKPQIGEGGTVRMVIYQENSSVVNNTTSNTAGPTTDKSSIETTVVVDDGQIMVLGGLLKDEYADGEDKVPFLASIPLIGYFFRSENRKRVKTNLLVFLRPMVMRTQDAADRLTMDRYEKIRAQQLNQQPRPSSLTPIQESPVLPPLKRSTRIQRARDRAAEVSPTDAPF
jgi:general secretion pathway protein D